MKDFINLLRIESHELTISFEKASLEGKGTPQEIADRREQCFSSFIRKYFPFPYRIAKGNIIDSYGHRSCSIDCIIINPAHPYTIDASSGKASMIMADAVDYAIDVKGDFNSKEEIERGLGQIRKVKLLERKNANILFPDDKKTEYTQWCKKVPAIIFVNKTYAKIDELIANIVDYYLDNKVPILEQFDMIVVNNMGVILNCSNYSGYANRGIYYIPAGEDTLATFLWRLDRIPKSEPMLCASIISIYLGELEAQKYETFVSINEKLIAHNI